MVPERTARTEALERLLLGFDGAMLPRTLAMLLGEGLAGVAIYPRNFSSSSDLRSLTDELRRAAAGPIVIGIDQEGGTKFSLPPPFTAWPSPAELGRLGDAALVEDVSRAIAIELHAAGVNTDFAPMLDLAVNPDSPVTRGRSFGRAPEEVARLGAAFLRGLAAEGVLACAKHFPGHGDTALDPHLALPAFDGTRERLQQEEFVPFAAAIEANVPMIMTAHILLPKIDPNLPASLSPSILDGMLRREMGFDGVIVADDLGMGALAHRYGCGDSAVMTLQAGTDIAMLCHDNSIVPGAIDALTAAIENGVFDSATWTASRARIARLRERIIAAEMPPPPLDVIGCRKHLRLAQDIRNRLAKLEEENA
jgi:beta-N-acetylhexosaminidase